MGKYWNTWKIKSFPGFIKKERTKTKKESKKNNMVKNQKVFSYLKKKSSRTYSVVWKLRGVF